ncbi:MAG: adenylate/guanylate cyclase domain-containing protein [Actinomycetota bacterium]
MRNLPSGTVTFLFTDVEGSTKLLHELGPDRYAEALAEHRRVVREAFGGHGGVEVDTQGDAFFVAFPTAPGALEAAAQALQALASGSIRVRIGIHTGTPHVADEGYVGVDVHRAARIAAAGHGGQVLLSETTRNLVRMEVRDLGLHRLKDLAEPLRLFQLGDGDFPPLKTLYRTNLPVPASVFVGRRREVAEVAAVLARADVRLLTLTGPGGTGKTRLGLQAAADASDRFPDGVFWVGLAALDDPQLVLPSVADALEAKDDSAVHIADKRMLLLLDNFEQVVDAANDVAALIGDCPNLNVIVTSREPLHVTGERVYAVPPLEERDATSLFRERAIAVRSDFSADGVVGEICRRLEGLPLAIELAAARINALSPAAILERLQERLPLLTGGPRDAPERHRTLRATIGWSYELLTPNEQRLFARLAVFAGGCTLEAAEHVCDADLDTLASLVDKSLARHRDDRYWMLETVREYADEQLEATGEPTELHRLHADWFKRLARTAEPELRALHQRPWLDALERELHNFRRALTWALEEGECELALTLLNALDRFWGNKGRSAEALAWFDGALAKGSELPVDIRARALWIAGRHAGLVDRRARAQALLEEAAPLLAHAGRREDHVFCLCELASIQQRAGNAVEATRLLDQAVREAKDLGQPRALSAALGARSHLASARGDYAGALSLAEESLSLRRTLNDPAVVLSSLYAVALAALDVGDEHRARILFREALELARNLGHLVMIAASAANLGYLELFGGNTTEARSLLREGLKTFTEMGRESFVADCVSGVAAVEAAEGRPRFAVVLWAAVDASFARVGGQLDPIDSLGRQRFEPRARATLSAEDLVAAAEEGAAMTLDVATQLALETSTE